MAEIFCTRLTATRHPIDTAASPGVGTGTGAGALAPRVIIMIAATRDSVTTTPRLTKGRARTYWMRRSPRPADPRVRRRERDDA